jgi:hypothetical protein
MKKLALSALALFAVASMAMAVDIVQFKAGDISVSVLDTDATTPMQTASVKALDASSGDVAAEAVSDELGQAVLSLDAGRYVMNVNDLNLAVFDVSAVEGLSLCRIIMPDASLLVGGQEASEGGTGGTVGGSTWMIPAGIAAAILLGGSYAAIENYQHHTHHHGNGEEAVSTEQTQSRQGDSSKPAVAPATTPSSTPSPK